MGVKVQFVCGDRVIHSDEVTETQAPNLVRHDFTLAETVGEGSVDHVRYEVREVVGDYRRVRGGAEEHSCTCQCVEVHRKEHRRPAPKPAQ